MPPKGEKGDRNSVIAIKKKKEEEAAAREESVRRAAGSKAEIARRLIETHLSNGGRAGPGDGGASRKQDPRLEEASPLEGFPAERKARAQAARRVIATMAPPVHETDVAFAQPVASMPQGNGYGDRQHAQQQQQQQGYAPQAGAFQQSQYQQGQYQQSQYQQQTYNPDAVYAPLGAPAAHPQRPQFAPPPLHQDPGGMQPAQQGYHRPPGPVSVPHQQGYGGGYQSSPQYQSPGGGYHAQQQHFPSPVQGPSPGRPSPGADYGQSPSYYGSTPVVQEYDVADALPVNDFSEGGQKRQGYTEGGFRSNSTSSGLSGFSSDGNYTPNSSASVSPYDTAPPQRMPFPAHGAFPGEGGQQMRQSTGPYDIYRGPEGQYSQYDEGTGPSPGAGSGRRGPGQQVKGMSEEWAAGQRQGHGDEHGLRSSGPSSGGAMRLQPLRATPGMDLYDNDQDACTPQVARSNTYTGARSSASRPPARGSAAAAAAAAVAAVAAKGGGGYAGAGVPGMGVLLVEAQENGEEEPHLSRALTEPGKNRPGRRPPAAAPPPGAAAPSPPQAAPGTHQGAAFPRSNSVSINPQPQGNPMWQNAPSPGVNSSPSQGQMMHPSARRNQSPSTANWERASADGQAGPQSSMPPGPKRNQSPSTLNWERASVDNSAPRGGSGGKGKGSAGDMPRVGSDGFLAEQESGPPAPGQGQKGRGSGQPKKSAEPQKLASFGAKQGPSEASFPKTNSFQQIDQTGGKVVKGAGGKPKAKEGAKAAQEGEVERRLPRTKSDAASKAAQGGPPFQMDAPPAGGGASRKVTFAEEAGPTPDDLKRSKSTGSKPVKPKGLVGGDGASVSRQQSTAGAGPAVRRHYV